MKIETHQTDNPEIEIIELAGELIGRGALDLQAYLSVCLDKGRYFQLMDLKRSQRIDGLGIKVICDFVDRGMRIGLFNVDVDVITMFRSSHKVDMVNIYNEPDINTAINMFEKTILETLDAKSKRARG